jgi:hypothetical protein
MRSGAVTVKEASHSDEHLKLQEISAQDNAYERASPGRLAQSIPTEIEYQKLQHLWTSTK